MNETGTEREGCAQHFCSHNLPKDTVPSVEV